jgi:hypothetical protein
MRNLKRLKSLREIKFISLCSVFLNVTMYTDYSSQNKIELTTLTCSFSNYFFYFIQKESHISCCCMKNNFRNKKLLNAVRYIILNAVRYIIRITNLTS